MSQNRAIQDLVFMAADIASARGAVLIILSDEQHIFPIHTAFESDVDEAEMIREAAAKLQSFIVAAKTESTGDLR
jgi:hypothetical protein